METAISVQSPESTGLLSSVSNRVDSTSASVESRHSPLSTRPFKKRFLSSQIQSNIKIVDFHGPKPVQASHDMAVDRVGLQQVVDPGVPAPKESVSSNFSSPNVPLPSQQSANCTLTRRKHISCDDANACQALLQLAGHVETDQSTAPAENQVPSVISLEHDAPSKSTFFADDTLDKATPPSSTASDSSSPSNSVDTSPRAVSPMVSNFHSVSQSSTVASKCGNVKPTVGTTRTAEASIDRCDALSFEDVPSRQARPVQSSSMRKVEERLHFKGNPANFDGSCKFTKLRNAVWGHLALNLLQQDDAKCRDVSSLSENDLPLNLSGQCSIREQTIIEHIIENMLHDQDDKDTFSEADGRANRSRSGRPVVANRSHDLKVFDDAEVNISSLLASSPAPARTQTSRNSIFAKASQVPNCSASSATRDATQLSSATFSVCSSSGPNNNVINSNNIISNTTNSNHSGRLSTFASTNSISGLKRPRRCQTKSPDPTAHVLRSADARAVDRGPSHSLNRLSGSQLISNEMIKVNIGGGGGFDGQ